METRKKLWMLPSWLEGKRIGRAVTLSNGDAEVETWQNGRWIKGGAAFHEFLYASPMSLDEQRQNGLPDDADPPDSSDN